MIMKTVVRIVRQTSQVPHGCGSLSPGRQAASLSAGASAPRAAALAPGTVLGRGTTPGPPKARHVGAQTSRVLARGLFVWTRNPGDIPMLDDTFHLYDTTLRDGAQQEGLNLSVADKLVIARQLDELGVGFIEGGWPGAIPKDTEFFRRAATEPGLNHAQLAAFGATRRPGVQAAHDPQVAALRESGAPVVMLVAN